MINPPSGLVTAGSQSSVTIEVTPIELIKFDIKFGLKVLGQREQEIRMTGEVIEPDITIPEGEFNFSGVPILMKASKQFHIENKVCENISIRCFVVILFNSMYKTQQTDRISLERRKRLRLSF